MVFTFLTLFDSIKTHLSRVALCLESHKSLGMAHSVYVDAEKVKDSVTRQDFCAD